jgi:hypothetical protein
MLAAADPALAEMIRLATKAENESVRRQAAADILDRAGLKAPDKREQADGEPLSIKVEFVAPSEVPRTWEALELPRCRPLPRSPGSSARKKPR